MSTSLAKTWRQSSFHSAVAKQRLVETEALQHHNSVSIDFATVFTAVCCGENGSHEYITRPTEAQVRGYSSHEYAASSVLAGIVYVTPIVLVGIVQCITCGSR